MASNPYGTSFPSVGPGYNSTTGTGSKGAGGKAKANFTHGEPQPVDKHQKGGGGTMKKRASAPPLAY